MERDRREQDERGCEHEERWQHPRLADARADTGPQRTGDEHHRHTQRCVQRGPTLDGIGKYYADTIELSDAELTYLTELDFENHVALVAMLDEGGIGVGRYVVDEATGRAEMAFTVDDAHQGLGVGPLLLSHLAHIARAKGIRELSAYVLAENRGMIEVFERAPFPMRRRREGNTVVVTLELGA